MSKFKVFTRFLAVSVKAKKSFLPVVLMQSLITVATAIFNIYSLKFILDALAAKAFADTLIVAGAVVLVNIGLAFLGKLFKMLYEICYESLRQNINILITTKIMRLSFEKLEDPAYLDLKERAKFASENQNSVGQFINSFAAIVTNAITVIGLVVVMLSFNYLILLVLAASVILSVLITAGSLKYQRDFFKKLLPINRKFGYYLQTIGDTKRAKDYRMFNISELMLEKYEGYQNETCDYFIKLYKKFTLFSALAEVINFVQMGVAYFYVAAKTVAENLGAGNFTLYVGSALKFTQSLSEIINSFLSFNHIIEMVSPLTELLAEEEENDTGKKLPLEKIETIEFRNVSFAYPKSKTQVLKNINFKIEKGEKISIVGLNGAGKTTMVKLLCRLYKATEGEILINGVDIKDYDYKSLTDNISAVFQDYKLFAYSLSENITNEYDKDNEAYEYAVKAGLKEKIDSLPEGIKSLYLKTYESEGIELSGGESQKVAIARALCKNSSLIILDEPTSALDPLAEADIYSNFNSLVENKTAIYISHRMSSSVFCDKILVVENGQIADFDHHSRLMKNTDSLYYKLFNSQAQNYKLETEK